MALRPAQSGIGRATLVSPVSEQVTRYLDTHQRFRPGQLVIVDGDTNDLYAQLADLCFGTDNNGLGAGETTRADADRAVGQAAADLAAQVGRIKANGGETVLLAAPFADRTYVWSDDFHPTARMHELMAEEAVRMLGGGDVTGPFGS